MIRKVINSLLIYLTLLIIFIIKWVKKNFYFTSFNQVFITVTNSVGTASKEMIISFVCNLIYPTILFILFLFIIFITKKIFKHKETILNILIKNKEYKINLFNNKLYNIIILFLPTILFVIAIYKTLDYFYVFDYVKQINQQTTLFEDEYINPKDVKIEFPKQKRNLIYIYLESMEATFASKEVGGKYETNYIPELTKLSKNNLSFSDTDTYGGAYQARGADWTIGAMIGYSAGIPYKTLFAGGNFDHLHVDEFMPGVYTIGEILEKEGYKNYLMVGSDAEFCGRESFFTSHGNYKIYDYYTAKEDNLIDEDYYVFWGYEDNKLFKYAKQKLKEISKEEEPFNFTMLTVDTHTPDGYLSDFCKDISDNKYLNSIACSSKQVNDFVSWIKKQDFYKNTTVILVGDHLSMNTYSFENLTENERRIYNTILNSKIDTECSKERDFNTFDFFPTTLASLGANIEGERLGLGTNLFSCKKTISEKYGAEYINAEILKSSFYYTKCFQSGKCEKE